MTTSVNTVLEIIPHLRAAIRVESIWATGRSYVTSGRHCRFGLSEIVVSVMSSPAGSVAVSARPAFQDHWFAVGEDTLITGRSETASERAARARSRGAV